MDVIKKFWNILQDPSILTTVTYYDFDKAIERNLLLHDNIIMNSTASVLNIEYCIEYCWIERITQRIT